MAVPSILVSDDNPNLARMLERVLRRRIPGASITLDTESRAPELAASGNPTVVVLDLFQPVSGMEQLRQLKQDPRTQAIPVLVMTAVDRSDVRDACVRMGAAGFFVKPFGDDLAELVATLCAQG